MRKSILPKDVFAERRKRLASLVPGSAVILPAWPEFIRNHDTNFLYRQESNLLYMTGFDEPGSCLLFRPGQTPETIMFVREKNIERETWDGFRFGPQGAKQIFGFDECYTIDKFEEMAPKLLKSCEKIYYSLFRNPEFDSVFSKVMMQLKDAKPRTRSGMPTVEDAYGLLGEMRVMKTEVEVQALKKAGEISAKAHIEVMRATRPGVSERELNGLFIYSIMKQGAMGQAYNGIFASGTNAVTLHYNFNENTLKDGDLFLVDAGAEYQFYSGDITRTYPVSGKFSPAQLSLYQGVLEVEKKLIEMVKPGLPHGELQKYTINALIDVLKQHKILSGSTDEIIEKRSYLKYYPHGVSHFLGLDTHDAGSLYVRGDSRPMEAGWCFTIEPGLYIPEDDESAPKEYRGIGIRIEDDIVVTSEGAMNLTELVPKDPDKMCEIIGTA